MHRPAKKRSRRVLDRQGVIDRDDGAMEEFRALFFFILVYGSLRSFGLWFWRGKKYLGIYYLRSIEFLCRIMFLPQIIMNNHHWCKELRCWWSCVDHMMTWVDYVPVVLNCHHCCCTLLDMMPQELRWNQEPDSVLLWILSLFLPGGSMTQSWLMSSLWTNWSWVPYTLPGWHHIFGLVVPCIVLYCYHYATIKA